MASISLYRLSYGDRWALRWNSLRGGRSKKLFRSRAEAEAYLPFIDERPSRKRGRGAGRPLPERIKSSITIDDNGCWIWRLRRMSTEGYGVINVDQRSLMAHRVSYEAFVGPIPEGLQLDHLCRVRECVNPDHLEPVTARVNVLRSPIAQAALNAAKTHCPWGHEYTPENTYLYGPHRRWRTCRTCVLSRAASKRGK